MAEVSFYLLASESTQQRYIFACKLLEKIYRSGQCCYVLTDAHKQSEWLDDLLWTFRPGSFIPHWLYTGDVEAGLEKVLIGTLPAPENWQKIVLNLSTQCPQEAERIIEIVDANPQLKEAGRSRYRHYQQAGTVITTHNVQ